MSETLKPRAVATRLNQAEAEMWDLRCDPGQNSWFWFTLSLLFLLLLLSEEEEEERAM